MGAFNFFKIVQMIYNHTKRLILTLVDQLSSNHIKNFHYIPNTLSLKIGTFALKYLWPNIFYKKFLFV